MIAEILTIAFELLVWSHPIGVVTCSSKCFRGIVKVHIEGHVFDSSLGDIVIIFLFDGFDEPFDFLIG